MDIYDTNNSFDEMKMNEKGGTNFLIVSFLKRMEIFRLHLLKIM